MHILIQKIEFCKLRQNSFLLIQSLFLDISKVQDDEVGDGTTTVAVLASELLRASHLFPHIISLFFSFSIDDIIVYFMGESL